MTRDFARRWVQLAAAVSVAVGLTAAAASVPALQGPWLMLFDLLTWPMDGEPEGFDRTGRALNAVLGGVLIGWSVLMWLLCAGSVRAGDRPVAGYMVSALLIWFCIDGAGSRAAGVPGNVVLNCLFLLMFLPPLLRLRHG